MPRGKFYLRCCDAMPHVCTLAAVVTVDQLSIGRDRVCCPHCRCNDDVGGTHTRTHTHTFNGPLSGTTQASRYQKGKSSLDFTEA